MPLIRLTGTALKMFMCLNIKIRLMEYKILYALPHLQFFDLYEVGQIKDYFYVDIFHCYYLVYSRSPADSIMLNFDLDNIMNSMH